MSGITVQVNCNFSGTDGLDAVASRLPALTPAMAAVGQVIRGEALRNFREGGVFPGRWKPSRRAMRHGGQTLMDTGILRNSISVQPAADGVAVGTSVPYAAIHQFGGRFTRQVKARTNVHGANGRFLARKKLEKRKTGTARISFSRAHSATITMPARPFLPIDATGNLSPETTRRAGMIITRYVTEGKS